MLLTIHNLPPGTQYSDIKELIILKCGLNDSILDNLQNEGNGMRVTVGVSEEEDAAILVRKINGLYLGGQQLYVEDKRQKRELEQPYRMRMAQPQYMQELQAQPAYDLSQVQATGMWPTKQPMANFMYKPQVSPQTAIWFQAVQSAYMANGQQQYSESLSQYPGALNEYGQQAYNQPGYDQRGHDHQGYDQQGHDQQDHDRRGYGMPQTDDLYIRRMGALTQGQTKTENRWGESRAALPLQGQTRVEDRWDDSRPALPLQGQTRVEGRWGDSRPVVPPQGQIRTETRRGESRSDFPLQGLTRSPNRWSESRPVVPPQGLRTETRRGEGRSALPLQGQTRAEGRWGDSRPAVPLQGLRTETRRGEGRPSRDRRRPAFDQETQPEPKRPKWDSKDDRHDRSFDRQDRFRKEHGQASRSVGLPDKRSKNGPNRWERPSDRDRGSRLESYSPAQPYRRDQPARQSHTQTDPSSTRPTQPPSKHTTIDTKLSKVKSMEHLMSDTIRNLHAESALVGPSVLKSALRKVVIARIDDIVRTKDLSVEDIIARYRNTYPESTDHDMYSKVKQKVKEIGGTNSGDMKYYAADFVIGERRENPTREASPTVPIKKRRRAPRPSRQYQQRVLLLANVMMYNVSENLKLEKKFAEPSPLKTLLRRVIMERIDDILKGTEMLPEDIRVPYRQKYPESDDAPLLAKVTEKLAEKGSIMTGNELKEYAATFVTEPSEVVYTFKTLHGRMPPKKEGLLPVPETVKIPNYPKGDKKVHAQQKKQHKLELQTLEGYEMDSNLQKAMDAEVDDIGEKIKKMLDNPLSENEKSAYENMNKEDIVAQCKKFLSFHISKRITDGGAKLVRIYGLPEPPNRTDLQEYLSKFNCLSLKKSVKSPFYTASFDSYETVDRLFSMPPVTLGNGISVLFKHMHIAPKKTKYSQKHWKSRRKQFIRSLVDYSRVNLLEKDWQTQEESEKKARAELIGSDEVICMENEQVPIVDITEDKTPHDAIEDSKVNDEEQGFLHEDFHVIDEVRESDDDTNDGGNDDQVDEDWDQTGEDWSVISNAGDENDMKSDTSAIENDENAIEGDEDAIGGDKDAIGGEDDDIGGEDDAIGGDKNAIGNDENVTESDENGVHDEDDNDIDEEIGENVEDIDIADVDWDDVDEDDLEDY